VSTTLELLRDLSLLEKIIVAVEAAVNARPGTEIGTLHGVWIAGKKVAIKVTAE